MSAPRNLQYLSTLIFIPPTPPFCVKWTQQDRRTPRYLESIRVFHQPLICMFNLYIINWNSPHQYYFDIEYTCSLDLAGTRTSLFSKAIGSGRVHKGGLPLLYHYHIQTLCIEKELNDQYYQEHATIIMWPNGLWFTNLWSRSPKMCRDPDYPAKKSVHHQNTSHQPPWFDMFQLLQDILADRKGAFA